MTTASPGDTALRTMDSFSKYAAAFLLLVTGVSLAFAEEEVEGNQDKKKEVVPPYKVTETEIQLPGVTISRVTSEIRLDAVACLDSGILEYVVCKPDTFEHEAIFTTTAKPELVHAALLLIGVEAFAQRHGLAGLWYEKALEQKASRVKVEVEWTEKDERKRVPLVSLLRSRKEPGEGKKTDAVADAWVFSGSFIHQNRETGERVYAANRSGILVGIWPNPTTVIQYGLAEGNPYEGKDLGIEIREDRVPKKGTRVQLVFSRFTSPDDRKEEAKPPSPEKETSK